MRPSPGDAERSGTRPTPPTEPVRLAALLGTEELGLRLLAGGGGGPGGIAAVDVHGVHASEMADPSPYLLGGELLLTAGTDLAGLAGARVAGVDAAEYVERLVRAGAAALGFGVTPVHEVVPQALLDACDRYGLPLLEVPPRTPFTAVARAVWRLMAQARTRELRRVTEAQQSLAAAAARPDPVPAVLSRLAASLGGWTALLAPEAGAATGPGTGAGAVPRTGTNTGTGADAATGTRTGTSTTAGTGTAAGPRTGADTGIVVADAATGTRTGTSTTAGTGTAAGPRTGTSTTAGTGTAAGPGTGTAAGPGAGADAGIGAGDGTGTRTGAGSGAGVSAAGRAGVGSVTPAGGSGGGVAPAAVLGPVRASASAGGGFQPGEEALGALAALAERVGRGSVATATDTLGGTHLAAYAVGGGHVLVLATPARTPGDHTIASVAVVLLSLLTARRPAGSEAAALTRLLLGGDPAQALTAGPWYVVHARGAADPHALAAALGTVLLDAGGDGVRLLTEREPAPQPGWRLGVSAPAGPGALAAADAQARRALQRADAARTPLARHADRGFAGLVGEAEARAHAEVLLAPLNPALRTTLRAWLAHHGSWDRTAAALGVHRNTVRQRIARCAALLDRDLDDPDTRMELWFALRRDPEA
ncbi:PucR family transcriptional regulator [Streptomyces sp. NPDC059385]|uniref:PucR family transcriptional regulator n=1 Tax=Streptomyces sp. NPDC059385 TaxID=3346817 RepID=UPI0036A6A293